MWQLKLHYVHIKLLSLFFFQPHITCCQIFLRSWNPIHHGHSWIHPTTRGWGNLFWDRWRHWRSDRAQTTRLYRRSSQIRGNCYRNRTGQRIHNRTTGLLFINNLAVQIFGDCFCALSNVCNKQQKLFFNGNFIHVQDGTDAGWHKWSCTDFPPVGLFCKSSGDIHFSRRHIGRYVISSDLIVCPVFVCYSRVDQASWIQQ